MMKKLIAELFTEGDSLLDEISNIERGYEGIEREEN
jgi:UDP-N-acetylglucosamine enolpyruvyl transferase